MTSTEPTVHAVTGWSPPRWATRHAVEGIADSGMHVQWTHETDVPLAQVRVNGGDRLFAPYLARWDDVELLAAEGTVSVVEGRTVVHVDDDFEVTPAEARKLARALAALADRAYGINQ